MLNSWFKRLKYKFAKELVFEDELNKILDTDLIMRRDICISIIGYRKVKEAKLMVILAKESPQKMDY